MRPFKHSKTSSARRRPSGFTLLEVVMALAVTALLLTAAVSLLTSISSIWLQRETRYFFVSHVNGVDAFLTNLFDQASQVADPLEVAPTEVAVLPEEAEATPLVDSSEAVVPSAPGSGMNGQVDWARPEGSFSGSEPMLRIVVQDAPALFFQGDERPLGALTLFLKYSSESGLAILWTDTLSEDSPSREDDYRLTPITSYVSQIEYVYWNADFDRWEYSDRAEKLPDQSFALPEFLKLTFTYQGTEVDRLIPIPPASTQVPLF